MPNHTQKPSTKPRLACRLCAFCDLEPSHVEALAPDKVALDQGWGPLAPHLESLAVCHAPDTRPEGAIVFKNDATYRCMWFKEDKTRLILPDDRKIIVSVPRGKK